jgi:hypothetical protein
MKYNIGEFNIICQHILILVNIGKQCQILHVKTGIFMHTASKLFMEQNIYQTIYQRKIKHTFYGQYTSTSLTGFEIIKQSGANTAELLHYTYTS